MGDGGWEKMMRGCSGMAERCGETRGLRGRDFDLQFKRKKNQARCSWRTVTMQEAPATDALPSLAPTERQRHVQAISGKYRPKRRHFWFLPILYIGKGILRRLARTRVKQLSRIRGEQRPGT